MCKEHSTNLGDHSVGDPPVLIPNTVVKPYRAESTWLDTAWEDMSSPDTNQTVKNFLTVFFYLKRVPFYFVYLNNNVIKYYLL